MGLVEGGKITLGEAAKKIGVSYRQAKRIRRALRIKGVKGIIHGNTGRIPWNRTVDSIRQRVIEFSRELYRDFNDMHFTEKLSEDQKIELSRETVRKLRRRVGIEPKRRRRAPRHRKRRERKAQEGAMVLWDGSPHHWLGPDQPACCLMAAIDDATGKLLVARFFPFEGSSGYLWLLRELVKRHGIPLVMYHDRHGSLHRNDSHWSLEEQLAGRQEPTQVGLALEALGIESIAALSPQAKGRIERLFGTLQDRLIAELGLEGVQSLEAANRFLKVFIPRFNRRFAVCPRESEKAWRKVPLELDLDRMISFRYRSVVGNDNSVRIGGLILDLPPGPHRRSYAKAHVEVRQLLDGSWRVYYQDQLIAKHPSTELRDPVRALKHNRHIKGASPEQWVYWASAPPSQAPSAQGP
ncbi:MAG: ISNCY family transposase [Desulfobacterales bacterium]|nr:ISNCY family transposase [Desulfobacterales bacterium]